MTALRLSWLCAVLVSLTACKAQADDTAAQKTNSAQSVQSKALTGPLSRPIRGDGGVSEFYDFKGKLTGAPGALLRHEPLEAKLSTAGADQSLRLLYTSTDGIDGETIIPVSGTLLLPPGAPPKGGWPLVLWSHGTVGIADKCAPSWQGYVQFHQDYLNHWLAQGYAIVTSDYQGLGTPGTHPYLLTRGESYSNLDVIKAVQQADFPVSDKVVLIGQSQGAGAVFATGGYAPDYAPALDIRAIVTTGLPNFSPQGVKVINDSQEKISKAIDGDKFDPMLGYGFLALSLIEQLDPSFHIPDYVSDKALPMVKLLDTKCHQEIKPIIKEQGLTYKNSYKKSPMQAFKIAFSHMGYPRLDLAVQVFVGSGVEDEDTPITMQAELVKQACAAGSIIEAHSYEGYDHLTTLNRSTDDSTPFVRAAFDGQPVSGNCSALPY